MHKEEYIKKLGTGSALSKLILIGVDILFELKRHNENVEKASFLNKAQKRDK